MLFKNRNVPVLMGVAGAIVIVGLGSWWRWVEPMERWSYDLRVTIRQPRQVDPRLVLIEVANDSIDQLGRWPFPRSSHAALVDILRHHGARLIAFDVIFSEPSAPAEDAALEGAIEQAGMVALPYAFRLSHVNHGRWQAAGVETPLLPEFKQRVRLTGHINAISDRDGKIRSVPLLIESVGELAPTLSLAMACELLGVRPQDVRVRPGWVEIGAWGAVPVDDQGRALVDFAGRWVETFRHYSYADVLASDVQAREGIPPRVDLQEFQDAICLVGVTATGLHDLNPVPMEPRYPMVGVHANVVNQLLHRAWLWRLPRWINLAVVWLLALAAWLVSKRARPLLGASLIVGMAAAWWGIATGLFVWRGWWLDVAWPATVLFGTYVGVTVQEYLIERQRRALFERELAIAQEIQQSFLPAPLPAHPAYTTAAMMRPAKEIGGDLYQWMALRNGAIGWFIADVSGKGIPAALLMAKVSALIKICASELDQPAAVLMRLNQLLVGELRQGRFLTACYAVLDPAQRRLRLANAGHLESVHVAGSGARLFGKASGPPIGLIDGAQYEEETLSLAPGDLVVMVTDGVVEGRDPQGREFGWEPVLALGTRSHGGQAEHIVTALVEAVQQFARRAPQSDDLTVVGIRVA